MPTSLVSRIRRLSASLAPQPTDASPHQPAIGKIRSVVFDIYGTLFISGSGDISLAQEDATETAAREAFEAVGLAVKDESIKLSDWFVHVVRQAQEERRLEGVEFPEVEIREVWKTLIDQLSSEGFVEGETDAETIEALAVEYECRANPVAPMPGLLETLTRLHCEGYTLGIVSNAQFFTPLLFDALLEKDLDTLGFHREARIYSFAMREGKPSTHLYQKLAEKLEADGIEPAETLYVGNDMRNDIWPAKATGFRTALFAGDRRSLRLRENDPRFGKEEPDWIITALDQLQF